MDTFTLKPILYFGDSALSALEALAGRRVLVVTDEFLARRSGLLERVEAHLKGCALSVFDAVKPDPSLQLVAQGVHALRQFGPEVVLAFGGGSPMDCAKAMRHFAGGPPLPLWCVPTTAGTGSEVTSFAVLTDTDAGVKYPLVDGALLPDAAVLDASLLSGVPPAVTADTGMDVLTHAAEACVATGATPFTDALGEKAFVLAFQNLPAACRGDEAARGRMLLASCLSGIAFNAAGLGLCHALSHALGGKYHLPHGRLNAMLLPHVVAFNRAVGSAAERYAHLARLCGLAGSARSLAAALSRLRQSLDMPAGLAACGVEPSALAADLDALTAAALADVCAPSNPRPATAGDLAGILKALV